MLPIINLNVIFCNPTEPCHCKSSVNDTVYTEVFFGTKPDMVFDAKVKNWHYLRN